MIVSCAKKGTITGYGDAGHGNVFLGYQLMGAFTLPKIPDTNGAFAVAADELALIGMDDDVSDRAAAIVVALDASRARVPDLDRVILGTGHHPLALAVEAHTSDITRVAFKGQDRARIGGLDIIELD